MLNFLRQEIAKKEQEKKKAFHAQEAQPIQEMDEEILKFAHLFQEMEELTIVGTNAQRERPVIDIPIEDDIELDLVEVDVKTGRIVDVPMDVQTNEAFSQEKTFDDFYQEASKKVPRFHRESNKSYRNRIQTKASELYSEYHDYIVQEGLFGNDMMSIGDDRVPSNAMVDLGPLHEGGSRHYIAKLPVFFETTNDHQISLNQIHALNVASNLEAFEHMGEALRGLLVKDGLNKELYNEEIWDIATPLRVIVPIVNEKFVVGIEFEIEGIKHPYPVMWSINKSIVRQSKSGKVENKDELMKKLGGDKEHEYDNIKVADKDFDSMKLVCKKDFKESEAIKEAAMYVPPNRWRTGDRFYQEAIDFGGGAPDPNTGMGGGATADLNNMGGAPDLNQTTPTANADASTATTNDVSQQIADSVANATAANTAAQGQANIMSTNPTFDANVDDTFSDLDNAMGAVDTPPADDMSDMNTPPAGMDDLGDDVGTPPMDTPAPAESLDDITPPDTDTDPIPEEPTGDMDKGLGDVDIDNMSMDDMIQQGIEKLKTLPMAQLKEFLSDGSGGVGSSGGDDLSLEFAITTETDEVVTEAFHLKKELSMGIRRILGDLNSNDMSWKEIFEGVKKDGKGLSKTLSRAIKTKDFSYAKRELEGLGHALNELTMQLDGTPASGQVSKIKDSIKNFAKSSKAVSKVIDLNDLVEEKISDVEYAMRHNDPKKIIPKKLTEAKNKHEEEDEDDA